MKEQHINIGEIHKIKEDVNKIASKLSKGLAQKARHNMTDAFANILDNFYKGHGPSRYRRTYNLRKSLISNRTYSIGGNRCKAIVNVGSSKMGEYNERITAGNVFNLMWIKGVRGLPRTGESGWTNPAWSGEGDPYHNIFNTSISIDDYESSRKSTPHNIMSDFVNNWGIIGINECDRIVNSIIDEL